MFSSTTFGGWLRLKSSSSHRSLHCGTNFPEMDAKRTKHRYNKAFALIIPFFILFVEKVRRDSRRHYCLSCLLDCLFHYKSSRVQVPAPLSTLWQRTSQVWQQAWFPHYGDTAKTGIQCGRRRKSEWYKVRAHKHEASPSHDTFYIATPK